MAAGGGAAGPAADASAAASLVSFLQSELLVLSNEIKRKHPPIKESIENIFQLIRKLKDDPDRPNPIEVFAQTEIILQPISLACKTGNVRIVAIAINCLQRLIYYSAFPRECMSNVFLALETTIDLSSDIQLKALQCLTPLLTNHDDLCGEDELIRLLNIAFRLHESKTAVVSNAAEAIIRQMLIALFERISNVSEGEAQERLSKFYADAEAVLGDVVACLDDVPAQYLKLSRVEKTFTLDLIESVLTNHAGIIRGHQPFIDLIRDKICPVLIGNFKDTPDSPKGSTASTTPFARLCRVWRLAQLLIHDYNDVFPGEVEIFVAFIGRIMDDVAASAWEEALVLEVARSIFMSAKLMEEVFLICDRGAREDSKESVNVNVNEDEDEDEGTPTVSPGVFKDLVRTLIGTMDRIQTAITAGPSPGPGQPEPWNMAAAEASMRVSCLSQVDRVHAPIVPSAYLLIVAFHTLDLWTGHAASLASNAAKGVPSEDTKRSVAIYSSMLRYAGKDLLAGTTKLFIFFSQYRQSVMETAVLALWSHLLTALAALKFEAELSELLTRLYGLSLPDALRQDPFMVPTLHASPLQFTSQHVAVIRMLLMSVRSGGIAEFMGSGWGTIARILHGIDQLLVFRSRKQQQGILVASASASPPLLQTANAQTAPSEEMVAQIAELSSALIAMAGELSDEAATAFVQGLGEVAREGLAHHQANPLLASSVSLPLSRLERIVSLLMGRYVSRPASVCEGWRTVFEQLKHSSLSPESPLRSQTVAIVNRLVSQFIECCPTSKLKEAAASGDGNGKSENGFACNLQLCLLAPIAEICDPPGGIVWPDVLKGLLEATLKYVQAFGEAMNPDAWTLLCRILQGSLARINGLIDGSIQMSPLELVSDELVTGAVGGGLAGATLTLYRATHDIAKFVCADGLEAVPASVLGPFVDLVAGLGAVHQSLEINIPLNTVRYLWDISDYLSGAGRSLTGSFELWMRVLRHLSRLGLDSRPELRNSAIQTLLRTINLNGSALRPESGEWAAVFDDLVFPFFRDLRIAASNAAVGTFASVSSNSNSNNDEDRSPSLPHSPMASGAPRPSSPIHGFLHFTRDTVAKQWDESEAAALVHVSSLLSGHFATVFLGLDEFEDYWRRFLATLKEYALLPMGRGSVELTSVALGCMASLVTTVRTNSDDDRRSALPRWREFWMTWCEVGEEGFGVADEHKQTRDPTAAANASLLSPYFTQDSLLKHLKMLPILIELNGAESDVLWLRRSLRLVTAALQCPTPSDVVRDVESPSELQRFATTWVFASGLVRGDGAGTAVRNRDDSMRSSGHVKALLLATVAEWLGLVRETGASSADSVPADAVRRQRTRTPSTGSNSSSSSISISSSVSSLLRSKPLSALPAQKTPSQTPSSTFIAMTLAVLERLPQTFAQWSNETVLYDGSDPPTLSVILRACGRLMGLKYQCPGNQRNEPMWRSATTAFLAIAKTALTAEDLSSSQPLWDRFAATGKGWRVLVGELETAIVAARTQIASSLLVARQDEAFDIQLLEFIRDTAVPRAIHLKAPESVVEALVGIVADVCSPLRDSMATGRNRTQHADQRNPFLLVLPSGLQGNGPSRNGLLASKESLVLAALGVLFDLVSLETATGYVLPRLLEHCRRVLGAAIVDRRLLLDLPFCRLRERKLLLLVQRLGRLGRQRSHSAATAAAAAPAPALTGLYAELVTWMAARKPQPINSTDRLIIEACRQVLLLVGIELGIDGFAAEEALECDAGEAECVLEEEEDTAEQAAEGIESLDIGAEQAAEAEIPETLETETSSLSDEHMDRDEAAEVEASTDASIHACHNSTEPPAVIAE